MGQHIVKQPNGKYAIFSSIVDDLIAYDATPEQVREHFRAEAIAESDRITDQGLKRADGPFGHEQWREDIETIRLINGESAANDWDSMLSVDPEARAANPLPTIYCPCGNTWTQEMHTVCPFCGKWPKP